MPNLRVYDNSNLAVNTTITLNSKASHHLLRVLRIKMGGEFVIFNGDGKEYSATLIAIEKKQAVVAVGLSHAPNRESPVNIELGQAISRGERMDYAIQKAVELGVSQITPLFVERCNVRLSDKRLASRLEHWRGVMIAACEQSGRCVVPALNAAMSLEDWILKEKADWQVICDPRENKKISEYSNKATTVRVLVGPEGGFTENEIKNAKQAGFVGFSLGPRVLRTETAAVVALALLQNHFDAL